MSVADITISDVGSLAKARTRFDLEAVVVETERLKYRGLLPCALKYALWAVRPGGIVRILDRGDQDPSAPPFRVPANLVRQWIAIFCARDAQVEHLGAGEIVLRRTLPTTPSGWSAGVVFSGRDDEIPVLRRCLDGLRSQPELAAGVGGEIVVCGPSRDLSFLVDMPEVRYQIFETPPGPRFLISRKKNALVEALVNPRIVVLHARIALERGALAAVPREFDISGPNTVVIEGGRRVPYLSLCQTDAFLPGRMARRTTTTMRGITRGDPLLMHARGPVFVDGGAFYAMRRVHADCPLNDAIAWEEGEDVEWCTRAFARGWLVDIAPDSNAVSATSKLRPMPGLARLVPAAYRFARSIRTARAGAWHGWQSMLGER